MKKDESISESDALEYVFERFEEIKKTNEINELLLCRTIQHNSDYLI